MQYHKIVLFISVNMELQPPNLSNRFYPSLDELVIALASLQGYAIVKRRPKTSKKGILQKAILMCDREKEYIDNQRGKRNTTSQKINCFFDIIASLEQKG